MNVRAPAAVQITMLALLSCSLAGAQADSGKPQGPPSKSPQPAAHAIGDEPPISDLEEKSWLILQTGLHSKRAAQREEAVKALSLLEGNHQAIRFSLRALRD